MNAGKSPPVVSVVLATYNWPSVLRYAIRTVLWQKFQDFELLVIGDGCTDDTADVVASFADPRIRWHNLPENTGNQSGPNNAGLKMARGKYVAYMHQDDLWLPDHLAVLMDAMGKHDAPLAHTLLLEVSPPPARIRRIVGLPGSGRFGTEKVDIWTPAVIHSTEAGRQAGGWRDWRSIYDTPFRDFLARVIGPERKIHSVREVTVVKFHSGQRLNSYKEQPCVEQAEYFERIQACPEFRYRELIAAMDATARGQVDRRTISATPAAAPAGWEVEQLRRVRGLGASALPTPSADRYLSRLMISSVAFARAKMSRSLRRRAAWMLSRAGQLLEP